MTRKKKSPAGSTSRSKHLLALQRRAAHILFHYALHRLVLTRFPAPEDPYEQDIHAWAEEYLLCMEGKEKANVHADGREASERTVRRVVGASGSPNPG